MDYPKSPKQNKLPVSGITLKASPVKPLFGPSPPPPACGQNNVSAAAEAEKFADEPGRPVSLAAEAGAARADPAVADEIEFTHLADLAGVDELLVKDFLCIMY